MSNFMVFMRQELWVNVPVAIFLGMVDRHQRPTKHIGYFGQRRWLCFSPKLEAENKVLN